jgi:hypothetical protein
MSGAVYALDRRLPLRGVGPFIPIGAFVGGFIGLLAGILVGLAGAALALSFGDRQPDSSRVAALASLVLLALVMTAFLAGHATRPAVWILLYGLLPVGLTVGSLAAWPLKPRARRI